MAETEVGKPKMISTTTLEEQTDQVLQDEVDKTIQSETMDKLQHHEQKNNLVQSQNVCREEHEQTKNNGHLELNKNVERTASDNNEQQTEEYSAAGNSNETLHSSLMDVFQNLPSKKSTPQLTSKEKIVRELEKMKQADDLKEEWRIYEYKKLYRKHKEELERQQSSKGIELNPGVNKSKKAIQQQTEEEEFLALKSQRRKFREESALIRRSLEEKMGILVRRENPELLKMVETFIYHPEDNSSIPEHILKVLSWPEIEDLKQAFDLFDVKGKGYINAKDVKRIAKMLGFRATKKVFDEMIKELAAPNKDRVTFINFLEFIIKSQSDGPDPYGEIVQAFQLMDKNENGYLTLSDLKSLCESVNLKFSNQVLREMIEEADNTGDGKISLKEFTSIMCQTGRFKFIAPK